MLCFASDVMATFSVPNPQLSPKCGLLRPPINPLECVIALKSGHIWRPQTHLQERGEDNENGRRHPLGRHGPPLDKMLLLAAAAAPPFGGRCSGCSLQRVRRRRHQLVTADAQHQAGL